MTTFDRVVVAIDAGKTKFLVSVFTKSMHELDRSRISVTTSDATMNTLDTHLSDVFDRYPVESIGLAIFGPLETRRNQYDFGAIIGSSDPQWSNINLPAVLNRRFRVPIYFDFDTNAALLAEKRHGTVQEGFIYLSIGTGIGGAFHTPHLCTTCRVDPPQLGHIYLPREPDDPFVGSCGFHSNCFQGLASGRALLERWQTPADEMPANHEAWDLQARYVARACVNLLHTTSLTSVRLGSGVSLVPNLTTVSNRYLRKMMNGFPANLIRQMSNQEVITRATTAPNSSLIGAAIQAWAKTGLEFGQSNTDGVAYQQKPRTPGK